LGGKEEEKINFESAVVEANSQQMLFPSHLSCSEDEAYSLCPVDAPTSHGVPKATKRMQTLQTPRDDRTWPCYVTKLLQGLHSLGRLRHSMGSGSLRLLQLRKPAGRTEEASVRPAGFLSCSSLRLPLPMECLRRPRECKPCKPLGTTEPGPVTCRSKLSANALSVAFIMF
jgi:hypothetical protein